MAQKEGYVSQADNNMTVVLDTNLTEELIEEGFVREIISKIQTMRKEADFEVTDKIVIYVSGNEKVSDIVKANADSIMSDVMALDIKVGELAGYSKEWNINGETVNIGVEK
jgi:isoleucyl-tRNA synthetase